jgi:hypothetical protein
MVPGWITKDNYDRVSDYLAEHVFCPDFQEAYASYLAAPPVWERRVKRIQHYLIPVYVGTYHFRDGLVVEHQVYEIPSLLQEHRDAPKQQHSLCVLQLPEDAVRVGPCYVERNRGAWPADARYAAWATQAPERQGTSPA